VKFLACFNHRKSYACINFDKKVGWATLWAIFSQTHPVTLDAWHTRKADHKSMYVSGADPRSSAKGLTKMFQLGFGQHFSLNDTYVHASM
jgi:hypothetical protein